MTDQPKTTNGDIEAIEAAIQELDDLTGHNPHGAAMKATRALFNIRRSLGLPDDALSDD